MADVRRDQLTLQRNAIRAAMIVRGMTPPPRTVERRYNPQQPRDPGGANGGQWVGAILREVIHASQGDVSMVAGGAGARLRFGDSSSMDLDEQALGELADLLGEVGFADDGRFPRANSVATFGPNGKPTALAVVHRPDANTAELELFTSDARLRLSAREADEIGSAVLRAAHARRVETASGPVDVWPADDDRGVIRVAARDGEPVEVHLNAKEVDALLAAAEKARSGRSGTVRTSGGPLKVRRIEVPDGDAVVEIAPADENWRIAWPPGEGELALDSLQAGLGRFEEWRSGGSPPNA